MSGLEAIGLIASIASIALAWVAIKFSLHFYDKSKEAETNTTLAINKIQEATDTLKNISMRLLTRMTTALIESRPVDEKLVEALGGIKSGGQLEDIDESSRPSQADLEQVEQMRIDNLIAALYYCALTNLATQNYLPQTIKETERVPELANILDQSKNDYTLLLQWLNNTLNKDMKINQSPVNNLYQSAISWAPNIKSVRDYYTEKEG